MFKYVPEFKVLACLHCKQCYTKSFAVRHATVQHGINVGSQREALSRFIDTLDVAKEVVVPADYLPALDYLSISTGWVCTVHNIGAFTKSALKGLETHARLEHSEIKSVWSVTSNMFPTIVQLPYQMFYSTKSRIPGNLPFLVTVSKVNAADDGAGAQEGDLVGDNLANFSQLSVDTAVNRNLTVQHDLLPAPVYRESSKPNEGHVPWAKISSIMTHLTMEDLRAYSKLTDLADQDNPVMVRLKTHLERTYEESLGLIDIFKSSVLARWVRTQIINQEDGKLSGKPFERLNASSEKNYRLTWVRFILYLIRVSDVPVKVRYGVIVPAQITGNIERVLALV